MGRATYLFSLLTLFFLSQDLKAQGSTANLDTAYIEPTDHLFAARMYLSHKYTNLLVRDGSNQENYVFHPNSGLNLGLGLTYQTFTLNVAVPFKFMNPGRQEDWPFYLDLQVHAYPQKWIFDLYGQFYRGYSVGEEDLQYANEKYLREDIKVNSIGLNANYLFWGEKLSLSAAFNQVAIQKKSAFSPFVGIEGYGGGMKGDSLLLPTTENVEAINFRESKYLQLGPNVGFAGTLVFGKGFFLTGVASVNYSVGFAEWTSGQKSYRDWGGVPTYLLRGFLGYNDKKFSLNVNYVYKNLNLVKSEPFDQAINTGNYRVNLIYKFNVSREFSEFFYKINPMRIINKNIQPY